MLINNVYICIGFGDKFIIHETNQWILKRKAKKQIQYSTTNYQL